MKTTKQLFEMYRDIKGSKCIDVPIENVQQFVDYCYNNHGLVVNGGAITNDGKRKYLYID